MVWAHTAYTIMVNRGIPKSETVVDSAIVWTRKFEIDKKNKSKVEFHIVGMKHICISYNCLYF